MTIIDGQA